MRIGIVSDTHCRADRLARAAEALRARGVDAVVHCGDVGSAACVHKLASVGCPAYMVAGNVDRHAVELAALAASLGIAFGRETVEVPLADGKALVATHGDDERLLGQLIHDGRFPYVCHGHTHRIRDERVGPIRIINPGALHNAAVYTVAILDTETGDLERIEVG